jgi:hypothetical protein
MKVFVEISYILKEEPVEFNQITDTTVRNLYIWQNRRGYLLANEPWKTFSRLSIMDSQPENSFMEVWSDDKYDISDPPNDTDDMWVENYKSIEKKNYTLEWHSAIKQLKITWIQSYETLKDHKIITQVMSEIENLSLGFPNFPTLTLKE